MGEIKKTKKCPLSEVYLLSHSGRHITTITCKCGSVGGGGESITKLQSREAEHTIFKVTTGLLWRDFSTVAPLPRRRFYVICSFQFHDEQVGVCTWRRRGVEVRGFFFFLRGGVGRGRVVDGRRSTQFNKEHSRVRKRKSAAGASLPSVVLDHVSQLDDELSLFVLLTALKRVFLCKTHRKQRKTLVARLFTHVHTTAWLILMSSLESNTNMMSILWPIFFQLHKLIKYRFGDKDISEYTYFKLNNKVHNQRREHQ